MQKTYDQLNFISKLGWSKIANYILLLLGYYISKWKKSPVQLGYPTSISVEPTTSCNLRCPECPSGLRSFTRPTGMLDVTLFAQIMKENHKTLSYLHLYFQGEPYLHPEFLKIVKIASDYGVYSATSTNAHYLGDTVAEATVKSGLDRLIISIDGTTQQTYEAYRKGGKLDKVLEGTKKLVHWKSKLKSKTPYLIFQFLVVKPNEHQIQDAKLLSDAIGVDEIKFKTAQIYDFESGSPLLPDNPKYSRYKQQPNGKFSIKNALKDECWKMWHSCVVTWDGKIVPCCFDKDAQHTMGNINGIGLKSIWKGEAYHRFRKTILSSRSKIEMCKNCTEGLKIFESA